MSSCHIQGKLILRPYDMFVLQLLLFYVIIKQFVVLHIYIFFYFIYQSDTKMLCTKGLFQ